MYQCYKTLFRQTIVSVKRFPIFHVYEGLLTMVPGIFSSKYNDVQLDEQDDGQLQDTDQESEDMRQYVQELQQESKSERELSHHLATIV